MGNKLVQNYTISQETTCFGGINKIWKIHDATNKTTKSINSVFIFDKRQLDKAGIKGIHKEEILKLIRKEVQMLASFINSSTVQIIVPLIEDTKRIIFITEKVQNSLASIIESGELRNHITSELDIKIHLLEIIEALSFLHSDGNFIHLSLSPENIYISESGKWKLGGFMFSYQAAGDQQIEAQIDFSPKPYEVHYKFYPNLSFMAPELCETSQKCHFKSDLFSFGTLLLGLLKFKAQSNQKDLASWSNDGFYSYKNNIQININLLQQESFFKSLEFNLQQLIIKLLQYNIDRRPTLNQVHQSDFFMDALVQSIRHLQRFDLMDSVQQCLFLDGFSKQFLQFEVIVVKQKILPKLMPYINEESLMPSIISLVVELTKQKEYFTKIEYNNLIWKYTKQISKGKQIPAKSLYSLVKNIQFFQNYIPNDEIQNNIYPLYLKCLECPNFKLQEVALNATESVIAKVDFIQTKTKIIPRILQLCLDKNVQTRILSLQTLKNIKNLFDNPVVLDQILTMMEKMRKAGLLNNEISELHLFMYKEFSEQMSIEVFLFHQLFSQIIINRIIPNILQFLLDQSLGKQLIQQFAQLAKNLISIVETNKIKVFNNLQKFKNFIDIPEQQSNAQENNQIQQLQSPFQINFGCDIFDFNEPNIQQVQQFEQQSPQQKQQIQLNEWIDNKQQQFEQQNILQQQNEKLRQQQQQSMSFEPFSNSLKEVQQVKQQQFPINEFGTQFQTQDFQKNQITQVLFQQEQSQETQPFQQKQLQSFDISQQFSQQPQQKVKFDFDPFEMPFQSQQQTQQQSWDYKVSQENVQQLQQVKQIKQVLQPQIKIDDHDIWGF